MYGFITKHQSQLHITDVYLVFKNFIQSVLTLLIDFLSVLARKYKQ